MGKTKRRPSLLSKITFKVIRFFGRLFYKKTDIIGIERLSGRDIIIVANHAQLHGPIIGELYMPEKIYTWANGQMVRCREVPKYAMEDFFPYKSKAVRPIFKLASFCLAPLLPCVINNARAIPVYRDARIVSTFRNTIRHLEMGHNILIFPECHEKHNNIVNKFQENFVDLAKLYYRKTKKALMFVPMYIAPELGATFVGEGTVFNSTENIAIERVRISSYLSEEITKMGRELPEHTVVPFDNISKKLYPSNREIAGFEKMI